MPVKSEEEIFADLTSILRDFDGAEFSGEIKPETRFFDDLGFASIDAVVLGEKLEEQYGRRFPFHQLLSELSAEGAEDMPIGRLTRFVQTHLAE